MIVEIINKRNNLREKELLGINSYREFIVSQNRWIT